VPGDHIVVKTLSAAVLTRKERSVLAVIDELHRNDGMRAIFRLRQLAEVELRHAWHAVPRWRGRPIGAHVKSPLQSPRQCLKALRTWLHRVLDFDTMVIPKEKKYAVWRYDTLRGTMGYFAFLDGMCVMAELEPGYHSPNVHIAARVAPCLDMCALANRASKAAPRLARQITHIRRAITCMSIPEVAPAYVPLIYRRAAAAVCTVSGVPRRAYVVRRV